MLTLVKHPPHYIYLSHMTWFHCLCPLYTVYFLLLVLWALRPIDGNVGKPAMSRCWSVHPTLFQGKISWRLAMTFGVYVFTKVHMKRLIAVTSFLKRVWAGAEQMNECWGSSLCKSSLWGFSTQSGPKSHSLWLAGARTPVVSPSPAAWTAKQLNTAFLLHCKFSQPVRLLVSARAVV